MANQHNDRDYFRGKSVSLETGIRALIEYLRETENDTAVVVDHRVVDFTPQLSEILDTELDRITANDASANKESFRLGFLDGKELLCDIAPSDDLFVEGN